MYVVSSNIRLLFFICQVSFIDYVVGEVKSISYNVSYYLIYSLYFVSFVRYTSISKLHKSILLPNFYDSPPFASVEAVEIIVEKRETVLFNR